MAHHLFDLELARVVVIRTEVRIIATFQVTTSTSSAFTGAVGGRHHPGPRGGAPAVVRGGVGRGRGRRGNLTERLGLAFRCFFFWGPFPICVPIDLLTLSVSTGSMPT